MGRGHVTWQKMVDGVGHTHTHITPHHPAGTFDWLDDFLENHPGYTEVSVPLLQLVGIQAHTTKSNHSA